MASRNFPRKVSTQKVINSLLKNCVNFDSSIKDECLNDMWHWCLSNIGPERHGHPIREVHTGWLEPDPQQLNWAWCVIDHNHCFWFNKLEDKISFTLTFK